MPRSKRWLAARPRYHIHFHSHLLLLAQLGSRSGSTSSPRKQSAAGPFSSVAQLKEKILRFTDNYNPGAHPFLWTATADSILQKIQRLCTAISGTQHYLIDNGWVKTFDIQKTVTVRRGTVPSTTTFYEVTAKGIDRIEGGSQFEPRSRYAGISIMATGSNIITLGDGNVVELRVQ